MSTQQPPEPAMQLPVPRPKDPSPWWRKLFSSNWWWYGEVNPDPATLPPLEQRPRYWRPHVWIVLMFWTLLLGVPIGSSYLNYEVPTREQLQTIKGVVVAVNRRSPHLEIRLKSGAVVEAEFPVKVSYSFGVPEGHFFDASHRRLVQTCTDVRLSGVYLRYVPFERFRIWEFQCIDRTYVATFEEISSFWTTSRDKEHQVLIGISVVGLFLFLIVYFIRERKDHGRKN